MTLRIKRVVAAILAFAVVAYLAFTTVVQLNQRAYEAGFEDGTFATLNGHAHSPAYSDAGDKGTLFPDDLGRPDRVLKICDHSINFREAASKAYDSQTGTYGTVIDNNGAREGCDSDHYPRNFERHIGCTEQPLTGCGNWSYH
jgi:hypothetical protein